MHGLARFLLLAALFVPAAGPALAQAGDSAGRFIVVSGDVRVVGRDGTTRVPARDGAFLQGESIITGPSSLAQLRMTDGGALSVRADTRMKLDAYKFAGKDDRQAGFLASVVQGGFRTITGLIGQLNRNNFRVTTGSATIGIRGTDFEVVHVLKPVADAAPGTYNRVYDGVTTFRNLAGATVLVNRDQTAFVALPGKLPPVLVAPPSGIFGTPTPPPVPESRSQRETDSPVEGERPAASSSARSLRESSATRGTSSGETTGSGRTTTAPLLNPIDSPRVLDSSTTLRSTTLTTPIDTSRTILAPTTPIDVSPATTLQVAPTIKLDSSSSSTLQVAPAIRLDTTPTTTTIQTVPTFKLDTTTIQTIPTTTLQQVAPTIKIDTTPTTTIQTVPTTSTIIRR